MKLYTEEKIIETFSTGVLSLYNGYIKERLETLTPIELPSDEEVEKKAESFYPISKEYKEKYKTDYDNFNTCWQEGAKWLKEQILNQNK